MMQTEAPAPERIASRAVRRLVSRHRTRPPDRTRSTPSALIPLPRPEDAFHLRHGRVSRIRRKQDQESRQDSSVSDVKDITAPEPTHGGFKERGLAARDRAVAFGDDRAGARRVSSFRGGRIMRSHRAGQRIPKDPVRPSPGPASELESEAGLGAALALI